MTITPIDLRHQAERAAGGMPALLLAAERVATTVTQGVHGRRRVGQGESFWQFRRYVPGDSVTGIDWRQSAKSDHVYVRQMEWEAAQSLWLWRDSSPSMHWRSDKNLPSKKERADLLALSLSILLTRGGERVTLLGSGQAPMTGLSAVKRLTTMLLNDGTNGHGHSGPPKHQPLPRFGHLVLISDFLWPVEQIHRALKSYAARGLYGHLVQILDPAEEDLPYSGRIRFEGLEGEASWLLSRTEKVRDEYIERLTSLRDDLTSLTRRLGWSFTTHRSDSSPESLLMSLYMALAERGKV